MTRDEAYKIIEEPSRVMEVKTEDLPYIRQFIETYYRDQSNDFLQIMNRAQHILPRDIDFRLQAIDFEIERRSHGQDS